MIANVLNESFVLQIKEIPSPSLDILSFYCFDAQYILTILSSGYHLNNTKANLTFVGSVSKMSILFVFFFFGGGARLSFLHNTDSSLLRTAKYKALKTLLALPLPRGYCFNMVTVFTRISATQMKRRPRILRQKINKPRPRISAVALIKSKSKGVVCWIGKLERMCWTFFYSFGSCFYIRGFLTKARLPADVSYFFYGARTTPWREMWIPEYGKFLLVESGIWEFFLRNPGLWNPEYNSRNPESH